ncbi:BTB/POZ and MATH domain-containing protein 2-like [Ananas comosus]|uniref:BTB/POZ and MATH domain-containing protein 2-like n=2 Tax=Ananas comosus TaxID=4615 RepID=A0A6P5GL73_ANACO|nr:BTB/POZ and MATH domain-containing protein 2-like [Ananas comosus]
MAFSTIDSFSSSTWRIETATGSHKFTVNKHSVTKGFGAGNHVQSGVFSVGGHDWAIRYYPDGRAHITRIYPDGSYGRSYESDVGTGNVSIYLTHLSDTSGDAKVAFKFDILDKNGSTLSTHSVEVPVTLKDSKSSLGWERIMSRADFERKFVDEDDRLTVRCTVTVLKSPHLRVSKTRSVASLQVPKPPPSDLHQHLGELLESGEGADVAFDVGGETFAAHRCVLAARSPVFRAELFGPMKEKTMQCIKIEDMDAAVFKAMLHFMYRDSLHQLEELTTESPTSMLQHLLAAADRYGLERLKSICEGELCKDIDVSTVATTLALAEQHRCRELKDACFDFINSPDTVISVMKTEGFEYLTISCPLLLKELVERIE